MAVITSQHLSAMSRDAQQAYGPLDEPWTWDVNHVAPDVNGQSWMVGE